MTTARQRRKHLTRSGRSSKYLYLSTKTIRKMVRMDWQGVRRRMDAVSFSMLTASGVRASTFNISTGEQRGHQD